MHFYTIKWTLFDKYILALFVNVYVNSWKIWIPRETNKNQRKLNKKTILTGLYYKLKNQLLIDVNEFNCIIQIILSINKFHQSFKRIHSSLTRNQNYNTKMCEECKTTMISKNIITNIVSLESSWMSMIWIKKFILLEIKVYLTKGYL